VQPRGSPPGKCSAAWKSAGDGCQEYLWAFL
jgi:hypothetical protein